jgi:hypothetical protein
VVVEPGATLPLASTRTSCSSNRNESAGRAVTLEQRLLEALAGGELARRAACCGQRVLVPAGTARSPARAILGRAGDVICTSEDRSRIGSRPRHDRMRPCRDFPAAPAPWAWRSRSSTSGGACRRSSASRRSTSPASTALPWRARPAGCGAAAGGVPVRFVGRPWRASTAEGYPTAHSIEQDRIIRAALAG